MSSGEGQVKQEQPNTNEEYSDEKEAIAMLVRTTAHRHRGDGLALLRLLRLLEGLHQEIRDGLFQETLPDNRQALYALLKDMEAEGGWPYINRIKLRALMAFLMEEGGGEPGYSGEPREAHDSSR